MIVMFLLELVNSQIHPYHSFRYLKEYNPDGYKGYGYIATTTKIERALRFENMAGALELWRKQSRLVPYMDNGDINRPLTMFSFELVEY